MLPSGAGGIADIAASRSAPSVLGRVPRRAMGYIQSLDPDGHSDDGETLMCVHCQMHWMVKPGSGKQRGWCWNCGGPTCGKQGCETRCIPFEKAIENSERKARNLKALSKKY